MKRLALAAVVLAVSACSPREQTTSDTAGAPAMAPAPADTMMKMDTGMMRDTMMKGDTMKMKGDTMKKRRP